jgi:hypothetical protein
MALTTPGWLRARRLLPRIVTCSPLLQRDARDDGDRTVARSTSLDAFSRRAYRNFWVTECKVENIAGAGGMMGASRVANATPDGYQFVLGNVGSHAANQSFYKNPSYDAARDFAPVLLLAETPMVLLARTSLPADN